MRLSKLAKILLASTALSACALAAGAADVTSKIIASGKNRADMTFTADDSADVTALLDSLGMTWIEDLVTSPQGATTHRKGEPYQLTDDGGFSFNIPTDVGTDPRQGAVRVTASFSFSENNIGIGTFEQMRSDIRGMSDQYVTEGGHTYFVPKHKDFLKKYGISIKALFTNGDIYDVTDDFDYRIMVDDADRGSLPIYLGALYADSNKMGSDLWQDKTTAKGETVTIFYDGKRDGALNGTFWLAKEAASGDGNGGGCNAGGLVVFALPFLGLACLRRKK